ncbi:MAG: RNA-binding S4 domain-containing protein [Thermodesulfobacteriota bacterium]
MEKEGRIRIDKWLWAARFFKTRTMAARAVIGGHVHLNGMRIKAARSVSVGDILRIVRNNTEFIVSVQALSDRRGPASVARELYEETAASLRAREQKHENRRFLSPGVNHGPTKRPDKKQRRLIRKFTRKSNL